MLMKKTSFEHSWYIYIKKTHNEMSVFPLSPGQIPPLTLTNTMSDLNHHSNRQEIINRQIVRGRDWHKMSHGMGAAEEGGGWGGEQSVVISSDSREGITIKKSHWRGAQSACPSVVTFPLRSS